MLYKQFSILIFASSIWSNNLPIVSSIEFKGHKITNDYIIKREIQHRLDIPLDSSLADQDKDRLLNLGIFADVSWSMVPLADLTSDYQNPDNLCICCVECNKQKSNLYSFDEFLALKQNA